MYILQDAVEKGLLTPGKRLLDSTSGNMGIAYATLAASMGIPVTLAIPENASPERIKILRALGAELVLTDSQEGSDGAMDVAQQMAELTRNGTSTPTSMTIPPTGRRISTPPARRFGGRPEVRSPTWLPGWAHQARSPAQPLPEGQKSFDPVGGFLPGFPLPRTGGAETHAHRPPAGDL